MPEAVRTNKANASPARDFDDFPLYPCTLLATFRESTCNDDSGFDSLLDAVLHRSGDFEIGHGYHDEIHRARHIKQALISFEPHYLRVFAVYGVDFSFPFTLEHAAQYVESPLAESVRCANYRYGFWVEQVVQLFI
jgi:hypothetical protein